MSSESQTVDWTTSESNTDLPLFTNAGDIFDSVQEIIGRKWHVRIVYRLLEDGPMGFSALKREIDGISSKMLSESLATLESEGLIDRQLLSDQPVRVEYSLTDAGVALEPVVTAMLHWGNEHGSHREMEAQ